MKILVKDGLAYCPTPLGWIINPTEETYSSQEPKPTGYGDEKYIPKSTFMGYMVMSNTGGNMNKGFWKLFGKDKVIYG